MKGNKEHVVPLSARAAWTLKMAKTKYGDDEAEAVFPTARGRMLRNAAFVSLLRDNDIAAVPHGFRSSFRDWAALNGWERDVAEAALVHSVGSATELAYKRTDLAKLRKMMEAWARFCTGTEERR